MKTANRLLNQSIISLVLLFSGTVLAQSNVASLVGYLQSARIQSMKTVFVVPAEPPNTNPVPIFNTAHHYIKTNINGGGLTIGDPILSLGYVLNWNGPGTGHGWRLRLYSSDSNIYTSYVAVQAGSTVEINFQGSNCSLAICTSWSAEYSVTPATCSPRCFVSHAQLVIQNPNNVAMTWVRPIDWSVDAGMSCSYMPVSPFTVTSTYFSSNETAIFPPLWQNVGSDMMTCANALVSIGLANITAGGDNWPSTIPVPITVSYTQ